MKITGFFKGLALYLFIISCSLHKILHSINSVVLIGLFGFDSWHEQFFLYFYFDSVTIFKRLVDIPYLRRLAEFRSW
jgi:hypothetical protein